MDTDIVDPPRAFGEPLFKAMLKQRAADFYVFEQLSMAFSGAGEHLYLQIEKTSMNSDEVVSILQSVYSVQTADIGLCGLKDRHAVATQWFSIKTKDSALAFEQAALRFNQIQHEQAQLLMINRQEDEAYCKQLQLISHDRHQRKLRRGAHSANEFRIVLRSLSFANKASAAQGSAALNQRIQCLIKDGFPAYIGAQRFGSHAQNLQRARQWFASPRKRISRQKRSLYLSAARSAIYNTVLAERVRDGSWQHLLSGEPAVLNGSRSFFIADSETRKFADDKADDENLDEVLVETLEKKTQDNPKVDSKETMSQRLRTFDLHPSAPWWGRGATVASDACAEYEADILAPLLALRQGLERAGLQQERRAARAQASKLKYTWLAADALQLDFSLAPGVFATTLLRELGACAVEILE